MYLFGPAYLFALFEVACDEPLDVCPDPHQYYPPWRFRFRECLKVLTARRADELAKYLGSSPPAPAIRESYIERLRYLRTLAVAQPDINAIQDNKIVSRAYVEIQSVLQNLAGFIETELGELAYDLHGERENFPTLIKRLSLGVPPFADWYIKLSNISRPLASTSPGSEVSRRHECLDP